MAGLIRPVEERDWGLVHDIVVEVARAEETYAMDVPLSVERTRAFWDGGPKGEVVVLEADGELLGTAKMGPNRPAQGSHVGTASFMVPERARGHGVGRQLAEYVVEWHREHGYRGIQFNAVVETNIGAVRLWQSLGFVIVGTVPGAFHRPNSDYVGLHVMYLDLVGD